MSEQAHSTAFEDDMSVIAARLEQLRVGALRLRDMYGEAAVESDLTFVRILERSYGRLADEIEALAGLADGVKATLAEELTKEA